MIVAHHDPPPPIRSVSVNTDDRVTGSAQQSMQQSARITGSDQEAATVSPDVPRIARILIVARPALSRALSSTLSVAGYEVHRTPDAASAVEAARRLRPEVAIVASEIPGSSGDVVARLLRASRVNMPVILMGEAQTRANFEAIVGVPRDVTPAELLAVVAQLLPSKREADESNVE
jgi:ActR/RegA family two-component response regulator